MPDESGMHEFMENNFLLLFGLMFGIAVFLFAPNFIYSTTRGRGGTFSNPGKATG